MDIAELIETIQSLPEAKQAAVYDFVAFLAQRSRAEEQQSKTLADSPLAELMKNPIRVTDSKPLSRDEANAR